MAGMERPDPDELLDKLHRDEAREQRGRLKIFFGASAGVGKTFAMLQAARKLRDEGTDVVVGVLETHGREETASLLDDLEVLPQQSVEYRGRVLREFDLDGMLARKPAVALIDELAHTNAPGSPREKRWQDVEILREAGIDVIGALNVQHIASMQDLVSDLTGITVRETVPDAVVEGATEIQLVDLPVEALLDRIELGKVYPPEQAKRARERCCRANRSRLSGQTRRVRGGAKIISTRLRARFVGRHRQLGEEQKFRSRRSGAGRVDHSQGRAFL